MAGSAPALRENCTRMPKTSSYLPRQLHAGPPQGGMQKRAKPRWSLPHRLRSEGWWLADPPRAMATLIPFVRKRAPTARLEAMGTIRS
ncbi:hypothetical protein EN856_32785 [Mesorhizobium sp. M8A.F.Ca.ET.213.01.1.1]|nr:hypothetical protein EN861_33245 [Mesorhizobium sp. M8A.F.Ca.ET.218.01.1.1]TGT14684.1 hypothetical protein EN856_32785 [Mesorhizobium sp. M8A.F.Ca.ET.213.01.1.1]